MSELFHRLDGIEQKYRRYECSRYGHLWIGMGYARWTVHEQCRRCGSSRTVNR